MWFLRRASNTSSSSSTKPKPSNANAVVILAQMDPDTHPTIQVVESPISVGQPSTYADFESIGSISAHNISNDAKTTRQYDVLRVLPTTQGHPRVIISFARNRDTGAHFIVKTLDQSLFQASQSRNIKLVRKQVATLKRLRHPNIASLCEVVADPHLGKLHFISDATCGEPLIREGFSPISESMAHGYFSQIIAGLRCSHDSGVPHYHLKPSKLYRNSTGKLSIVDLGTCLFVDCVEHIVTGPKAKSELTARFANVASFPVHLSPESANGDHFNGKIHDMWGLGVCLYFLVYGKYPFEATSARQMYIILLQDQLKFPRRPRISKSLKSLLKGLLDKNPATRMTFASVWDHPWVRKDEVQNKDFKPRILVTNTELEGAISLQTYVGAPTSIISSPVHTVSSNTIFSNEAETLKPAAQFPAQMPPIIGQSKSAEKASPAKEKAQPAQPTIPKQEIASQAEIHKQQQESAKPADSRAIASMVVGDALTQATRQTSLRYDLGRFVSKFVDEIIVEAIQGIRVGNFRKQAQDKVLSYEVVTVVTEKVKTTTTEIRHSTTTTTVEYPRRQHSTLSLNTIKQLFEDFAGSALTITGPQFDELCAQLDLKPPGKKSPSSFAECVKVIEPSLYHPVLDSALEAFQHLDGDRSGEVSLNEIHASIQALCNGKIVPMSFVESTFAELDVNGDGSVTFAEYASVACGAHQLSDQPLRMQGPTSLNVRNENETTTFNVSVSYQFRDSSLGAPVVKSMDIFPCETGKFPPDAEGRFIHSIATTFGSSKYDAVIPVADGAVDYIEVTVDVANGVPMFGIVTLTEAVIKTFSRTSSSLPHQSSHYTPRPKPSSEAESDRFRAPEPPASPPQPREANQQLQPAKTQPRRGSGAGSQRRPKAPAQSATKPQHTTPTRPHKASYTPSQGEAHMTDDALDVSGVGAVIKLPKGRNRPQGQVRGLKLKSNQD
eukprot:c32213_g1_i1.p1 GENE.c32213_g1_i1~~c32213_g1_i1.p1  ORF type:complete len:951 (+),score=147.00 c32213_g1_i1:27-2879(+)